MRDNITQKLFCIKRKNKRDWILFEESIKQIDYENKVLWFLDGGFTIFESVKIEYHYFDTKKMKICKKLD